MWYLFKIIDLNYTLYIKPVESFIKSVSEPFDIIFLDPPFSYPQKEKLLAKHKRLLKESYELSTQNRSKSDDKAAEADQIMKQIEALEQ